jgi:acyl-CoA reductase-like NAD-dependent aldehyde dehydrogenase
MAHYLLTCQIGSCSVEFIDPHDTLTGWCWQMEMLIGGTWRPATSGRAEDVTSPFDGAVIGTVPVAGVDDVRAALNRAEDGAVSWRRTPAFERMRILMRAAELADERAGQTARIISAESGKTITEARGEAARSGDLIRLAAFEGTQLGSSLTRRSPRTSSTRWCPGWKPSGRVTPDRRTRPWAR